MGGAFDPKTKVLLCNGQAIVIRLNQVFRNPNSRKYQQAQENNRFGDIKNVEGNWKDLLIAYLSAGVDVGDEFPAWVAYLESLGAGATGTQGPLNIYNIAQTRNAALTSTPAVGMETATVAGGGPVHTRRGSGAQPSTIDSPCPP